MHTRARSNDGEVDEATASTPVVAAKVWWAGTSHLSAADLPDISRPTLMTLIRAGELRAHTRSAPTPGGRAAT
ncbi:hypothetical protein MLGJGCBP_03563 [Rhodococcus sp. T7]|nr:hypothetical protein MLGJGCBP_09503 [Rhodococcus sp. T7]KAF0963257.1 hypothetical protein MLGJGCBP_03563 [Rhodococcus sp. T7]